MRRSVLALIIALCAGLALAACGDEDSGPAPTTSEYKATWTKLGEQLNEAGMSVSEAVSGKAGTTKDKLEKAFSEAADKTRDVADEIESATPPEDPKIEAAQEKLVDALNAAAKTLDEIGEAAGDGDTKAAAAAAAQLNERNAAITEPRAEIEQALGLAKPAPATTQTTTTEK